MRFGHCALALMGCALALFLIAPDANAIVIDFTGGTAYLVGGGTVVTDNTYNAATNWGATDYYEENGFRLDFIGEGGIIGDYYGGGNDVIHGHWATGDCGFLTAIRVDKTDGDTFDLNYFELTSNTEFGGGMASGNEQSWVTGYDINGNSIGSVLLPPDAWGWTGANPQVFLDSAWDDILYFEFTVTNNVDCFGMDMFYINEPAPPPHDPIPEPGSCLLLGMGLAGLAARWHRKP